MNSTSKLLSKIIPVININNTQNNFMEKSLKAVQIKTFKRAYGRLSLNDSRITRDLLTKRLKWSTVTFYQKKEGKRSITIDEADRIETVFRLMGLDAWTGKKIIV